MLSVMQLMAKIIQMQQYTVYTIIALWKNWQSIIWHCI